MRVVLGRVVVSLMLAMPLGCSGDDDDGGGYLHESCEEICSAAQQESCTVVDCDCDQFCVSLTAFKSKGGCGSTANGYEDCALKQPACSVSSNCGSEETAFAVCVQQFCAANPSDSDCVFLMGC